MSERGLTTSEFRQRLATWFAGAARDLPWRNSSDPYRTWVSEVLLQQTRVDQAIPYFERFLSAYPTVEDLAGADLDGVLLNWEGLGYYSRARNLHAAAGQVVRDHGGVVPSTYEALRGLPGIGDYTASAIGSLSFGLREAVLDGNVIRVLSRYDAVEDDVGRSAVRRRLRERAQELLDPDRPGLHNEALMEMGATVCVPRNPSCGSCPVALGCEATRRGRPHNFPVKRPKARPPTVDVAIGVISRPDGRVLIQRRPPEGLLGGLWEFPGGKCRDGEAPEVACVREVREEVGIEVVVAESITMIRHAYSHFRIRMFAYSCRWIAGEAQSHRGEPFLWVPPGELKQFAFPRANRRLIDQLASERMQPGVAAESYYSG
jgi:A/G-specific adenine glycosylase